MAKLSMWRKQNDKEWKDRDTTTKMRKGSDCRGRVLMEKDNMENRSRDMLVAGWAWTLMGYLTEFPPGFSVCVSCLLYLFRREYAQSASIFTYCHTHLCQQGLPVVKAKTSIDSGIPVTFEHLFTACCLQSLAKLLCSTETYTVIVYIFLAKRQGIRNDNM